MDALQGSGHVDVVRFCWPTHTCSLYYDLELRGCFAALEDMYRMLERVFPVFKSGTEEEWGGYEVE